MTEREYSKQVDDLINEIKRKVKEDPNTRSLSHLSIKMGKSRDFLTRRISNNAFNPDLQNLVLLAEALNCHIELVDNDGKDFQRKVLGYIKFAQKYGKLEDKCPKGGDEGDEL